MIVLGIDTALRCTGYGVVEVQENHVVEARDCGVIRTNRKAPHSECLARLSKGVQELVDSFSPEVGVIEGGFYGRNVKTAMILGMARGVAVSVMARAGIRVYEYAPRKAKQVIAGYGGADKARIAGMIANMLKLKVTDIPNDATDALAMAMCHVMVENSHQGIFTPAPL